MKIRILAGLLGLVAVVFSPPARAAGPVDCTCVENLPSLVVSNCPALVPDLCSLATNCFSTNVVIGAPNYCFQIPPPGTPASAGTNFIMFTVMDSSSNYTQCAVPFIVVQPPTPTLTLICASNKTVECGSGWAFNPPIIVSTCCDSSETLNIVSTTTNGVCPPVVIRIWQVTNICGLSATCSQEVTVVDTLPPTTLCSGVNFVPNWNFENYTGCPSASSQFDLAAPWFTPTAGTSDYYHSCSGPNSFVSTPTNSQGVQVPLSGQAYGGIVTWSAFGNHATNSYREYMEVPLLWSLVGGQRYSVSFYVSRSEVFANAMAEIGAHFSMGAITNYGNVSNGYWGTLTVTPQVENSASNILASTNSWMLVQGSFIAAGGETHLTIGNFRSDPATTAVPASGSFINYAYYYVEDVVVQAMCPSTVTSKTIACGLPWDFDEPTFFDQCSGTNVTVNVVTVTNGTCPQNIVRTWKATDLCGNTNYWSQTVTIVDNIPPAAICGGANLVPNAGFESFNYCPTFVSQANAATPWFNASVATPDYFNPCTTFAAVSVPTNLLGVQTPFGGQAYMGAFVYSETGVATNDSYREYVEVPLLAPLVAAQTYRVSFRVSLADRSDWAVADIGAHFSAGPVFNNINQGVMPLIPQVVNPATNLLTSTNSWMLVQGTFTAVGGEDHLTLGNFLSDPLTTVVPAAGNETNFAYYYYDDVVVEAVCSPTVTNKTVICGQPWSFDAPTGFDQCSGTNVAVTVISTVTNTPCPLNVTRTWLLTDLCGNTTNVSQTVTVTDTVPPIPLCEGANLAPNPGFETITNCPANLSDLSFAVPWYQPTQATPDLFNVCSTPSDVAVPTNFRGVQVPFAGQAYAGMVAYSLTFDYREYLQAPLLAPMVAGQTYAVSFRVNLADSSGWAIAELGAHFSVGAVTNPILLAVLPVVPQVENAPANLLASTNSWMLVQGNYTAIGGENFITVGNFRTDLATTITPSTGPETSTAYYYIDEVKVLAPCTVPQEVGVPCGSPLPTVTAYDACSGTNITTTFSDVTNSICPLNITRTWSFTDLCGNSTNVTQNIFILDNIPPAVNCACLLSNAQPLLFTNGCSGTIPDLSSLTNAGCATDNCGPVQFYQSPPAGNVVSPGAHPITLTFSDCYGNSTNCVLTYYVLSPPVAIFTPPDIFVLTCSNSAVVNYNLNYFGLFGVITCTPPSGSAFPLGTNVVTCIGTTSCGDPLTNTFNVIVRSARVNKWDCMTFVIGIPYRIIDRIGGGGSTARMVITPNLPGGGSGANFENFATSGQDGPRFDFGAAEKFTFSTELDFNAADGAGFDLTVPPGDGETIGTLLLRFRREGGTSPAWHVTRPVSNPESPLALYRSIAIGTNGELFSSFTSTAAELNTNVLLHLAPMNGATSVVMTVTFDCHTRELMLDFPFCDWMPDAGRKGWDGCIYGYGPRGGTKTNKTARLILTPLTPVPPAAITNLDLVVTNLSSVPFDNPSITANERRCWDGHVTILKAFDDGTEEGVDFTSLGEGGGIKLELGHASGFEFRSGHFQDGDVPDQEQIFRFVGSPLTTNSLRFTKTTAGVECAADFTQWGVSDVTVQLWDGATLVGETNLPATLATTLVTLSDFPGIIRCPSVGVLSLSRTNPTLVSIGLACTGGPCEGDELRIIPALSGTATPPAAFTGLECVIGDGMDNRISNLHTTPACTPAPINVTRTASGVILDWSGEGFRLQGAEKLSGPWYDLGEGSPVTLPANSSLRLFRLRCD